ncbi:MAG: YgiQ family radical SAM protein, partial [Gammaproteobacteria bacterium]|nr:YgiQ family radical SAM protein [Gammaproteobacteria bacterium]
MNTETGNAAHDLFARRKYWAHRLTPAPFLPMTREEMDALGWDQCDVILVTGDAYVDHPSFGMAIVGRVLESQGFRVGIIAQPDWRSTDDFERLGEPALFFGVTAGNMDSMVNRYTADRRIRRDDAYTPAGLGGRRPDRSVIVYAQRLREAFAETPLVIGGIEASLRRIAHYDYWQEKVRRSILLDARADLLVFGNGERQVVEIAHRIAAGEPIEQIKDIRGTAFAGSRAGTDWTEIDSTHLDAPGQIDPKPDPYAFTPKHPEGLDRGSKPASSPDAGSPPGDGSVPDAGAAPGASSSPKVVRFARDVPNAARDKSVIRLPDFEQVENDPVLYAHASRILHLESNPGNARALVQRHGKRDVWLNPPPLPLATEEMDRIYELPYKR